MNINYNKSPDSFKIDGVSCSAINVWCDTLPVPPMAKQRYTTYETGRDEDITTPDESYQDISYKLTFYTFDRDNYDNSEIYKFFAEAKTLEISKLPGKYFKIRKVELSDPAVTFHGDKVKYTANLTLAPFKYAVDNEEIQIKSGDIIDNSGNRFSKPTIEIAGSGTVHFYFNGVEFTVVLKDSGQYVIIDSSRLIAYDKETGKLLHNLVDGYYPMLAPNANQISWVAESGEHYVVYVKIKKNERWY